MTRRSGPIPLLALLVATCGSPDAQASNEAQQEPMAAMAASTSGAAGADDVLGTIEATVDGTPHTWYVVAGDIRGEPYASAAWYEPAEGKTLASIGGFVTRDPPLDTFERSPDGREISFGSYEGPVLGVLLSMTGNPRPFRVELPSDDNQSNLTYMSAARFGDLSLLYAGATGVVDVTALELSNGRIRAEGTFYGTLENLGGGASVEVTDGRFDVEGVPHLNEIGGSVPR